MKIKLRELLDKFQKPKAVEPAKPEPEAQPPAGRRGFRTITNQTYAAVRSTDPAQFYKPRARSYKTSYF